MVSRRKNQWPPDNSLTLPLGKERKGKVGSDPQAMFIYWLSQKQYSRKKLLLTVMEYFIV